jgi:cytochrome c-type biogenesis protein
MLCAHGDTVGYLAAAVAGLVSFLSPCVLPLVPGYLSAVAGVGPGELGEVRASRVIGPALLFVLSFSVVFIVLFGLPASAISSFITRHQDVVEKVSGVLIMLLGVFTLLATRVLALNREFHVGALTRRAGRGGPVVAGAAFGLAWTPCIGPTLGAISTLALNSSSPGHAVVLVAVYAAGLAVPFLLTAVFFGYATTALAAVKRHYGAVVLVSGVLLIARGLLLFTGEFSALNRSLSGVSTVDC